MPKRHPFDEAYSTGIDRAVPPSQRRQLTGPRSTRRRRPQRPPPGHPGPGHGSPDGALALGGSVIGASGSLAKGWVVVSGDHIVEVRVTKPSGIPAIATGGVILPGLHRPARPPGVQRLRAVGAAEDLHQPRSWRASDEYAALVKDAVDELTKDGKSAVGQERR